MSQRAYDADDFLRSVRTCIVEKTRCEALLRTLWAQCEKITAAYGPLLPGGGDAHRDALLLTVAEQSDELLLRTQDYVRRITAVEDFIATMPDVRHRAVLRLRYVDCKRWDDVRESLKEYGIYYEDAQIFRLHGKALQEARRRFPGWAVKHPEILPKEDTKP